MWIRRLDGSDAHLDQPELEEFADALRGDVLVPDDGDAYEEARTSWNAMIDRRPALIARCRGTGDVMRAVRFAAEHEVLLGVRGCGHNIAGKGICDGGLQIDLSPMRSVRVDPEARRAWVEPGCTLADFDAEAQAFGLATPTGINSTTGVAGLTLGGGFGWLTRKYGLTVDNLVSADVVTADGERVRASEDENPDLFWALRGGGGNFGVVTAFEFQLHPVGPDVHCGLVLYPLSDAGEVLRGWRDLVEEVPDELSVWAVLRQAPPLPFVPEEWHFQPAVALAVLYSGDPKTGAGVAEPVTDLGEPFAEHLGPNPYVAFQQAFDGLLAPGARNYWKSHDLAALPDEAIDVAVEAAGTLPTFGCELFLPSLGGAMARVGPSDTAYAGRDASYILNVHARWDEEARDEECVGWARGVFEAMKPFSTGRAYVNFMTGEETERVGETYGSNWSRLRELKREWDPSNLFRVNQNIPPAT